MHKHFFVLSLLLLSSRYSNSASVTATADVSTHDEISLNDPALNDLVQAARIGDIEEVERQLEKKLDINGEDENGWSPILAAASRSKSKMIRFLVEKGADINKQFGKDQCCALRQAMMHEGLWGIQGAVRVLLELGACPNTQSNKGETALHIAALYNNIELTNLLLHYKASVHLKKNDGESAYDITTRHAADGDENSQAILSMFEAYEKLSGSCPARYTQRRELGQPPRKTRTKARRKTVQSKPILAAKVVTPLDTAWPTWDEAHGPQADQTETSPPRAHFPIM